MLSSLLLHGDARVQLAAFPANHFHAVVTSPPYWGLRDYALEPVVWPTADSYRLDPNGGVLCCDHQWSRSLASTRDRTPGGFCEVCRAWRGCLGLEPTISLYVQHIVGIFRDVRRVLRPDGTLWLNLGDSWITKPHGAGATNDPKCPKGRNRREGFAANRTNHPEHLGLKTKDMAGVPWRVAFALQDDGWWLRTDIVWEKPNCTPGSYRDRPTTSHEYIFLLSKSARYYYDWLAIAEPTSLDTHARYARDRKTALSGVHPKAAKAPGSWDTGPGTHGSRKEPGPSTWRNPKTPRHIGLARSKQNASFAAAVKDIVEFRNKRTVWRIPTTGCHGDHTSVFPAEIPGLAIQAATSENGCCAKCGAPRRRWTKRFVTIAWKPSCQCDAAPTPCRVLDPFAGMGTTGLVAKRYGRDFVGIDLSAKYVRAAQARIAATMPLLEGILASSDEKQLTIEL